MSKIRTPAMAVAAMLLVVHAAVLFTHYGTDTASLWGDIIGPTAAPFLAAIAAWFASPNPSSFSRRVWRLVSLSLLLAAIGGAFYTYSYDIVRHPTTALWPSDVLVFFWPVPAMMALFLSPRDPSSGFRWLRVCDFVQVCALVLSVELSQLYMPSSWERSGHAMALRALYAGVVFFGMLTLSFLARGLLSATATARRLFLRLAIFFFTFAITTNVTLYGYAADHYQQGTWIDLLWTISYCLVAVMAATWKDVEPEVDEKPSQASRGAQLLAQFFPLLIPAVVFPLVLSIAQEQFVWAVVLVIVSFAAASGRLFVVQNQLLVNTGELQKNFALLQGITEGTTDAVFVKDIQGRYLMINTAGAGFLGRRVEEIIGKDDAQLFLPEIGRVIMQRDRAVLQAGKAQTYEEFGTAAGKTRLYLSTKGPLRDANGQVVGLLGICRDITARKRAEEEIQQSQQRLRTHIENTPLAVVEWDLQFRVASWNRSAERIFGYTREEAMGQHARFIVHPDFRDRVNAFMHDLIAQKSEPGSASRYGFVRNGNVTKDGRAISCEWYNTPLVDDSDRVLGVASLVQDVTEREGAEEQIRASQQKLRIHLEHTPLAVVEWDLEFRVVAWNSSAERIFGYSADEAIGKHASFIIAPQFREHVDEVWQDVLSQKIGVRSANDNLTKDGRTIPCEWYNTPLVDDSGRVLGVASLAQDVTERVTLEERLRQSQKMEAVGRLAGGVAHDFNNLLTVILGYSQILSEAVPVGSRQAESTTQIKSAAEKAAGITRQLLAFSRKQVLSPRILNLNDTMMNLDSLLRRLIGEDIEVLTVPANDLGSVRADPGQIEQVIMNLALNSRDAMPHGGKLTLETLNVQLDETYASAHQPISPGRYVMLAVSDTGLGMEADVQARIFEPFFTTKEVGKGTGLGLSTVYGIVKQSGGFIWVYSERDRGTTFKIYLPRVDQPAETLGNDKRINNVLRGVETILLVEDDPQLRQLTSSVLAHCGYRMLVANGPEEGLEKATANHRDIRLLITDVVMPGMNGRQLAEKILKVSPTLKVLYISGYTNNAIVHYGVLDEGLWFLAKPFSLSALMAKVREVLDAAPGAIPGESQG